MYSVVLLAAVTMGGESADFGRRGGCHGCYGGCYGGGYGGCYGGGYGGCYGGRGYGGCYGGGCYGGGGYGGGCYGGGGYGGCYGGGGYGGGCYGGGGYGGCYGGGGGCYGGYASAGPVMSGSYVQGAPMVPQGAVIVSNQTTAPIQNAGPRSAPATVIVRVPADAKLTVDGAATTSTAAVRTFQTPDLAPGKVYAYTFKASFKKDGKPVSVTRKVRVQAGRRFNVDLNRQPVVVASN